mmetsp:Transcript_10526/g.25304  ORF Transcript_10526/g.25304 Transcript_10526/m.25304 type:complete len:376 (+) Transcript_10526:2154-3281(+)
MPLTVTVRSSVKANVTRKAGLTVMSKPTVTMRSSRLPPALLPSAVEYSRLCDSPNASPTVSVRDRVPESDPSSVGDVSTPISLASLQNRVPKPTQIDCIMLMPVVNDRSDSTEPPRSSVLENDTSMLRTNSLDTDADELSPGGWYSRRIGSGPDGIEYKSGAVDSVRPSITNVAVLMSGSAVDVCRNSMRSRPRYGVTSVSPPSRSFDSAIASSVLNGIVNAEPTVAAYTAVPKLRVPRTPVQGSTGDSMMFMASFVAASSSQPAKPARTVTWPVTSGHSSEPYVSRSWYTANSDWSTDTTNTRSAAPPLSPNNDGAVIWSHVRGVPSMAVLKSMPPVTTARYSYTAGAYRSRGGAFGALASAVDDSATPSRPAA